jgi:hypothetical protein
MNIYRVAHSVDRWLKRPRFRTPGSGIALAVLLVAVLLLRAYGSGAPRARPPYPSPPPRIESSRTTAPLVQIQIEESPAPIPTKTAEPGCPEGCAAPPPGCDVKGNISTRTGERIYHLPGQSFYDQTKISPGRGEAWFCTEAEARANGWRKSKR